MFGFIVQRPWLGHGYGGFWSGWEGPAGQIWVMLPSYQWYPGHGHNGLLDLWADLGVLGVIIFAVGYIKVLKKSLIRIVSEQDFIASIWPALYLIFVLVYSSTETIILVRNNIFWVLYVATTMLILVEEPPTTSPAQLPNA